MDKQSQLPCAVILSALPVEYLAVRRHVQNLKEEVYKGSVYERGIFQSEACQWEIGIVPAGVGNTSAATEAERAIDYFQPRVVLFVGVAGGIKDVKIGDVVVATEVYGYESGKSIRGAFLPRPDVGESSYSLVKRAEAEAWKNTWLRRIQTHIERTPQVYVGRIASGEKVIASTRSEIYSFLQTTYSDTLAVEMEARGFLKATHANENTLALIIRGISDLLNNKSKADGANFQKVAAQHASAFAFEVLANYCAEAQAFVSQKRKQSISEEGKIYLEQGQNALSHEDYMLARQPLTKALRLFSQVQAPEEDAQTRFLLALVYLRGSRPFGVSIDIWERVEELLRDALRLNPRYSYLLAFALFELDFSRHGWKKARYTTESQRLLQVAKSLSRLPIDELNLGLLWKCQARLMQEFRGPEE